jgi:hypothetical protein
MSRKPLVLQVPSAIHRIFDRSVFSIETFEKTDRRKGQNCRAASDRIASRVPDHAYAQRRHAKTHGPQACPNVKACEFNPLRRKHVSQCSE